MSVHRGFLDIYMSIAENPVGYPIARQHAVVLATEYVIKMRDAARQLIVEVDEYLADPTGPGLGARYSRVESMLRVPHDVSLRNELGGTPDEAPRDVAARARDNLVEFLDEITAVEARLAAISKQLGTLGW